MRMFFSVLALLTAHLTGQAATIQIDASALSVSEIKIFSVGNFSKQASVNLSPGTYLLGYVPGTTTGGAIAGFEFTVDANGLLQYSSDFDSFLQGRGTSSLLVQGIEVSIQSKLSVNEIWLQAVDGWSTQEPISARLLPGIHSLGYYAMDAEAEVAFHGVDFTVQADSTVSVASDLQNILAGHGSANLTLVGLSLTIESELASNDTRLFGVVSWSKATTNPTTLQLLPGRYGVGYLAITAASYYFNGVSFTLGQRGVSYNAEFEGLVSGAGSDTLRLHGFPVAIDLRKHAVSSYYLTAIAGFDNNASQLARLFPGVHQLQYDRNQIFDVNEQGACDLSDPLDNRIFSAGSQALLCANRASELSVETPDPAVAKKAAQITASIADADLSDASWILSVDYGDGTAQRLNVTEGDFTLSHVYEKLGQYRVRLSALDSRGAVSTAETVITVQKSVQKNPWKQLLKERLRALIEKRRKLHQQHREDCRDKMVKRLKDLDEKVRKVREKKRKRA